MHYSARLGWPLSFPLRIMYEGCSHLKLHSLWQKLALELSHRMLQTPLRAVVGKNCSMLQLCTVKPRSWHTHYSPGTNAHSTNRGWRKEVCALGSHKSGCD